jgi:ADP-heptose:LPS heptosyltransferase
MAPRRSVLFLIRDKLGDSLIAANVALAFARAHPEWSVSVMIRDAYAHPLAAEPELEIIPYRTGTGALLRAWWWRLSRRRFDVLGVMRGFGERTMALVTKIPARRIIVHDARLASVATEVVAVDKEASAEDPHYGPALRVARALDAAMPEPRSLRFPELSRRWLASPKRNIVICPLSDELRRNIPAQSIEALYAHLTVRHPDQEVLVLVRERQDMAVFSPLPKVPVTEFHDIPGLLELLMQSSQFYGTDTGLLHLAIAMGLPCVVFFGPTQPQRVLPPDRSGIVALRVPVLGERHCDVKSCTSAVCIARAAADLTGAEAGAALTPGCPLAPER